MMILINNYIDAHKNAWSATTLKSEKSRLVALSGALDGLPPTLWGRLAQHGSYTRTTTWTRVVSFWSWLIQEGHRSGPNPYEIWRKSNAQLFKNTYKKKEIGYSFEEMKALIERIEHKATQRHALTMLGSGVRWCESNQETNLGYIIGKGGRLRPDFRPKVQPYPYSYQFFWKQLKAAGLTPHMLRKAFATKLVASGCKEADLLKIMGWSSIVTAQSYLQPRNEQELKALVEGMV